MPPQLLFDTVSLKQGQILFIHNQNYIIKTDTSFLVPSSMKYVVRNSRSQEFYNRLNKRAQCNRFFRELQNMLLVRPEKKTVSEAVKINLAVSPFTLYSGRPIRHINFRKLDVFGPTIEDTTRLAQSWIEKTGNKLHTKSRTYLIRYNLMFKEGEAVNPVTIADNERILRALPYIEDASISIHAVSALNDSVDITVITKDVWSKAFDISMDDVYSGKFKLWDSNIIGSGQGLESDLLWKTKDNTDMGYEGHYTIDNIAGTFIKSNLSYNNGFHSAGIGLNLSRTFFTPDIKYAGGISLITKKMIVSDTVPLRYNSNGLWLGRSFQLNNHKSFTKIRQNITLTAYVLRNNFFQRPDVAKNNLYDYQNKLTLLSSISYSRQSYFKSNLIYNFGRTEDIPVGGQLTLTLGVENNEFYYRRDYAAISVATGILIGHVGYFNTNIAMGSFFDPQGHLEQSVISGNLNYFSPLVIFERLKFRQFFNLQFIRGANRFTNEYLTINKSFGLLGFQNDSIRGSNRFNTHWETVCFSPLYFYDFRFVFFTYADHSWITKDISHLFQSLPYTGIGFGIRIRNERLVFKTIQIRFSFYPNLPSRSKTNFINLSGESVLTPPSFLAQPAALIPYN